MDALRLSTVLTQGDFQILPTFTVLICTHNRPDQRDRGLASVDQLEYPHFDVLVVDSAPQDAAAFEVARRRGVRYMLEPVPGVEMRDRKGEQPPADRLGHFAGRHLGHRNPLCCPAGPDRGSAAGRAIEPLGKGASEINGGELRRAAP